LSDVLFIFQISENIASILGVFFCPLLRYC